MKKLTELGYDEFGKRLWMEPYEFRRLFMPGQEMILNGVVMTVISCVRKDDLVITIVRLHGPLKD